MTNLALLPYQIVTLGVKGEFNQDGEIFELHWWNVVAKLK